MTDDSGIEIILVEGGPSSGAWFRSEADFQRFRDHPKVKDLPADLSAAGSPLQGISLKVAGDEQWGWLTMGVMLSERGYTPARFKSVRF